MRAINLSKQAAKFLRSVPPKQGRQLARKLMDLQAGPVHDARPLRGTCLPYLRTDVGEYRIIYLDEPEEVQVDLIGKRNDDEVYRKFARKRT